jgi:hypothetical protein
VAFYKSFFISDIIKSKSFSLFAKINYLFALRKYIGTTAKIVSLSGKQPFFQARSQAVISFQKEGFDHDPGITTLLPAL